jgi:RNA 2',3'-cyclic 3'-phosphodiesterase
MRLFTAIDLPGDVLREVNELIERLRPAARIKWSVPENLHITTKFIGEWPEDRLEDLKTALAGVPCTGAIPIAIRGVGFFPNERSPRVFWAGVEAPPPLNRLASVTDQALKPLGIEAEKRPFSPHLTLARIKEPVPLTPLRDRITQLASTDFGSFDADRFYLYQSRLRPSGSVYTKVSEFPLEK